ncbi:MAG: Glutathione S-transferase [Rhodospirillales bacterium]|nr:Glutathione S-transferase [Rhodospirillales bacterium]
MTLKFYGHPFSSYCQKALIALYENDIPFEWRILSPDNPDAGAEMAAMWPIQRFPVLVDGDRTVMEATIIVEHLGLHHPGPVRLIPDDAQTALGVRMMDRIFDNYVMTPQGNVVFESIRPPGNADPYGVAQAKAMLETSYRWLDGRLKGHEWAVGDDFTLADCAAGPSLFYADWTHPIPEEFTTLLAYRKRLLARPSFARAVDEARPFRAFFPLGAPDRD